MSSGVVIRFVFAAPTIFFVHLYYKDLFMIAVLGTYENGHVKLEQKFTSAKPVKVIITFLEEVDAASQKPLSFSDFSFSQSRKALENYKGSLSDVVIEERRLEL